MSKTHINLEDIVMSQIKHDHITMKPRWFFVLGSFAVVVGIIASFVATAFVVSIISFSLRTHGPMGQVRFQQLLSSFPWWAPIVGVVGLGIGIWFLRKYDFSYKKNFQFIACMFVIVVILSGWLIDYLGINIVWSRQGPMHRLYQQYDGGWRGGEGNGGYWKSKSNLPRGMQKDIYNVR